MHPYLLHRNYLTPRLPFEATYRDHTKAGAALLGGWARSLVRRWKRRKMIAALQAMDDRILNDIGIHRGEIVSIVEGFDDDQLGKVTLNSPKTERGRGQALIR